MDPALCAHVPLAFSLCAAAFVSRCPVADVTALRFFATFARCAQGPPWIAELLYVVATWRLFEMTCYAKVWTPPLHCRMSKTRKYALRRPRAAINRHSHDATGSAAASAPAMAAQARALPSG